MTAAIRLAGALLLLTLGPLSATATSQTAERQIEVVRQSLAILLPDIRPDSIRPTPIAGLYEVVVGSRLVYVTGDGRYLVEGEIIDLERQQNLTSPRLNEITLQAIEAIGEGNMLVYEPPEKTKHTVTVFTDIDSAFSRKLHQERETYSYRGIRMRYLFFPRAGEESESYDKAVAVWCADDRKAALEQAMAGQALTSRPCDHPVQRHLQLAKRMGVSGAPVLVLENGDMLPGYVEAERLYAILDKMKRLAKP